MIDQCLPPTKSSKLDFSWASLSQLAKQYGKFFYILDLQTFDHNYRGFISAFQAIYQKSRIAYSYKTNYIPRLCQYVNAAGGYAEVVSGMEYQLALRVGVSPERIIFNGPYKTCDELEQALLAGSIINLDSPHEVAAVEAIAARHPNNRLRVGLRCNFPIDNQTVSRFGFDVASGDLDRAVHRLKKHSNCDLIGLHCHFSTRHRSLESFALRTSTLLELCHRHFGPTGPSVIDIGGGFFGPMTDDLKKLFNVDPPSFEDYAAATATQLAEAYPSGNGPELILEPGSALVANTMHFIAEVIERKKISSRQVAVIAGSIHNIKPTLHTKKMPVRIFSKKRSGGPEEACEPTDLVGYTCMEHDCLHPRYERNISVGDYAVFGNVGDYTIVMKPPFIQPSPAIVATKLEGPGFELVKRKEEPSDLFSTYLF